MMIRDGDAARGIEWLTFGYWILCTRGQGAASSKDCLFEAEKHHLTTRNKVVTGWRWAALASDRPLSKWYDVRIDAIV